MKVLLYKRTHESDPAPDEGIFGVKDCMGSVRCKSFDTVIGVGGVTMKPRHLVDKATWAGIGRMQVGQHDRGPMWGFQHFKYFEKGLDMPDDWLRYLHGAGDRWKVIEGGSSDPLIKIIIEITILAPCSPGLKKPIHLSRC